MESEKVLEIKKRVSHELFVARIPKKSKVRFQEIANEEFAGDYGMTIKWLVDFKDGLLTTPNQVLMEQVQILTQRVEELSVPQEPIKEKKVIRSVSGRAIAKIKGE